MYKVYKFGGAALQNAENIQKVIQILSKEPQRSNLLIIVSAMGKTTNALESVLNALKNHSDYRKCMDEVKQFHFSICQELFMSHDDNIFMTLQNWFSNLESILKPQFDFLPSEAFYDFLISQGEILSSMIFSRFLEINHIKNQYFDVRKVLKTDEQFREGNILWEETQKRVDQWIKPELENNFVVTQGFIASTLQEQTTTLGREGSDYSAAIFAHCLNAESLTIWKDVDGFYNGDPKEFQDVQKFDQLSYKQTAELSFYGASVVHPKTILPLAKKNIPLYVRSYLNIDSKGTIISENMNPKSIPVRILKKNLNSFIFSLKEPTYMSEEEILFVLDTFYRWGVKIFMIHRTAAELRIATDRIKEINVSLNNVFHEFTVSIYEEVSLFTILNYPNKDYLNNCLTNKNVLWSQHHDQLFQAVIQ